MAAEVKLVAASQLADHTRCTSGNSPATASKINPIGGSLDGPDSTGLRPGSIARESSRRGQAQRFGGGGHAATPAARAARLAGAYLLRRDLVEDGTVELTAHTFWESPEAIRAFAGDDITVAVVEPEAQAMLLDFDRTAADRSVVVDALIAAPG